jgi:hypothetical protein
VPDPERVAQAAAATAAWLDRAPRDVIVAGLRAAADPVAALYALERLLARGDGAVERPDLLLHMLGGSPSLAGTLIAQGAAWRASSRASFTSRGGRSPSTRPRSRRSAPRSRCRVRSSSARCGVTATGARPHRRS